MGDMVVKIILILELGYSLPCSSVAHHSSLRKIFPLSVLQRLFVLFVVS
jgi:hypothetical protein